MQDFIYRHFPAGVGGGFITFRLSAESIARVVCFSAISERDKSRPYACWIACLPEDCLSVINHVPSGFILLDSSL